LLNAEGQGGHDDVSVAAQSCGEQPPALILQYLVAPPPRSDLGDQHADPKPLVAGFVEDEADEGLDERVGLRTQNDELDSAGPGVPLTPPMGTITRPGSASGNGRI
jgi:hypothetical protein